MILEKMNTDRPNFVFGVSIMGHGPYSMTVSREPRFMVHDLSLGQELQNAVERYCEIAESTDQALARLHRRLTDRGRPYVLVVFGDHVPLFTSDLDGLKIWENILKKIQKSDIQKAIFIKLQFFYLAICPALPMPPWAP